MENLQSNQQGLFEEIIERGRAAGATTMESFVDLVDEVIEEHRNRAELDDDQDLSGMAEQLKARFGEYQELLANA